MPELYSQFDFANPDITTGKRYETTVPQQALFMMNNPLVVELARKLVNENDFKDLTGEEARIKFLYERIFQREAQPRLRSSSAWISLKSPPPRSKSPTTPANT